MVLLAPRSKRYREPREPLEECVLKMSDYNGFGGGRMVTTNLSVGRGSRSFVVRHVRAVLPGTNAARERHLRGSLLTSVIRGPDVSLGSAQK